MVKAPPSGRSSFCDGDLIAASNDSNGVDVAAVVVVVDSPAMRPKTEHTHFPSRSRPRFLVVVLAFGGN
jgi:hypothetical protein